MAWIELHQSLPAHRKTMRLRRELKIKTAQAVGHLCMLWLWCLDNCPSGDISGLTSCEIAEAAGYEGKDPDAFVSALQASGYLDDDMHVHDWEEYAGRLIDKRSQNAQRMRDKRARAVNVHGTCSARATHVQGLPYPTVPNSTVPNSTVPLSSSTDDSNSAQGDDLTAYITANLYTPTSGNWAALREIMADGMSTDMVKLAVDAANAQNARTISYVMTVLNKWLVAGHRTPEDVKAAEADRKRGDTNGRPHDVNRGAARGQRSDDSDILGSRGIAGQHIV